MSPIIETRDIGATVVVLEAFTALALAVLVIGLCALLRPERTSLPAMPLFFVVLFLAAWAGGVWGDRLLPGDWPWLYWMPYLVVSAVIGLLLTVSASAPSCRASVERATSGTGARPPLTLAEAALWTTAAVLAALIAVRYAGIYGE